jgi:oxygen-independent coproporphyrinogen III oxidase
MTVPLSVYLHIPFCQSKCTYCAFNTYIKLENLIPPFINSLLNEIYLVGAASQRRAVQTVFFGGGTPSLLSAAQIERILRAIDDHFELQCEAEITLEANPNDLNMDYVRDLRAAGINRLSLGVQSTQHRDLKLFARRHDNDHVAQSVRAARRAGFENINMDLIYGAPHQTLDGWSQTVNEILALAPDHLSLYALGVEEGTPLHDWVTQGQLPAPDEDLAADMYDRATELLDKAGYRQYEVSNWAKAGKACQHNLQYWRNLPYVGLGPGAHGFADGVRYWTILSPQGYIAALRQLPEHAYVFPCTPATDEAIVVDREGEIAETLIMGLRLTEEGIQRPVFQQRFGQDLLAIHGETLQRFAQQGLLEITPQYVRLTTRGRLLSNIIFRELV